MAIISLTLSVVKRGFRVVDDYVCTCKRVIELGLLINDDTCTCNGVIESGL